MQPEDEIEEIIENAVGELYRGFYRVLNLIMQDRQELREIYKVNR